MKKFIFVFLSISSLCFTATAAGDGPPVTKKVKGVDKASEKEKATTMTAVVGDESSASAAPRAGEGEGMPRPHSECSCRFHVPS